MPTERWKSVSDEDGRVLSTVSNDVGPDGVVFLPELVVMPHGTGVTSAKVTTNKPLTDARGEHVHGRLLQSVPPGV